MESRRLAVELRDAVPAEAAQHRIEVGNGRVEGTRERAVARGREVDVEIPEVQHGSGIAVPVRMARRHDRVGRARRWGVQAVEVRGQRRELVGVHVEEDRGRRVASLHRRAVERGHAGVAEGTARELVGRHVVRVGPDAPLRVVRNVQRVGEVVAVVGAGRVARLRDRHADVELVLHEDVEADVAHHPAVCQLVVLNDGIGHVLGLAEAAEALEERGARQRADEVVPVRLVVDVEDRIDELEVLRRADGALGVRRGDGEAEERSHLRGRRAVEVEERVRLARPELSLDDRVDALVLDAPHPRAFVSRGLMAAAGERLRRRVREAQRTGRVVLDRVNHVRRRR